MALKRNQGRLHGEAIDQLHFSSGQTEKAGGRTCARRVAVASRPGRMPPPIRKKWKDLQGLVMGESESHGLSDKRTAKQRGFHISSLGAGAETFRKLVRQHWGIENGRHRVPDTCLGKISRSPGWGTRCETSPS